MGWLRCEPDTHIGDQAIKADMDGEEVGVEIHGVHGSGTQRACDDLGGQPLHLAQRLM
jgi:hypothetical protein